MNKKILRKAVAIILVITLTFVQFIFPAVYAVNENYEQQETSVNKTDVSFDAYFVSEEGVKTHQKVTEMNNDGLKLFLSASVTTGYLKDAVVSVSNSNFKLVNTNELPNGVEAIDTENNTVTLNQISKGETREIELPIEVVKDENFNLDNFSKDTEVKLTGIFVNNKGKEIKAEKAIVVNLALSENAEGYLTGKIVKYAVFEENEQQKALLQLSISSKVQNNLLPVKYSLINVQVPKLFGLEPESVNVTSSSTRATNGDNGTNFNENNYRYADGVVTIGAINQANENNEVKWVKDSTDEYLVNLVYVLDNNAKVVMDNPEESKIQLTAESKLSLYNNEEKTIQTEISGELQLPEASQSTVSYSVNNMASEIAKGYMLVKNSANTEYKQEIKINIGYFPTLNNIEINKNEEYYADEQNNQYTATTYYKQINVNVEDLVKILGENGTISIMSDGVTVATLNKDNTSYVFEQETSDIMIITSQPIQNGILTVETTKYIKSAEYNETIINKINKLSTSIIGKVNLIEEQTSTEIPLVQPTLQISSSIKSSNLSTVIENKNVEIRVTLKTNNPTNRLFKNPVVEIELPSYIQEIKVDTINILYNEELKATTGNITTNSEGNKVIRIELVGEQTKFNDVLSVEGTTLILGASIIVDKTAPSITQKMNVRVTNNNEEVVETSSNISYMAPIGIITLNSISGYNDNEEELTSMSGEEVVGKLEIDAKSKIATETITVINNNDYTCGNIVILGRTPTEGNKSLITQDDLGSTFTAKMVSKIEPVNIANTEGIAIYYSENENATKDLGNSSNGWTLSPENLENVKSYLIIQESEIAKGDKLVFSYDVEIPEGLSREESTYGAYQVSYMNLGGKLRGALETITAPIVGLSTGSGPELKVELSSNVENGAQVYEGQIIEYTIKVTNIGQAEAKNVTVESLIPNGSIYTTYELDSTSYTYEKDESIKKYTETIESIPIGESVETKFLLTVGNRVTLDDLGDWKDDLPEDQLQEYISTHVTVSATATIDDEEEGTVVFKSNQLENEKTKSYFNLILERKDARLMTGKFVEYELTIDKWEQNDLHNLEINWEVPNGLTYVSSENYGGSMEETIDGSKVTWKIETLDASQSIQILFTIDEIKEDKSVSLKVQGTCDEFDGTKESNTETFLLGTPKFDISYSSNNSVGYVTEGDEIVYTISIKNTTPFTAYNVKITDYISDGLFLETLKYTLEDEIQTYNLSGTTAYFTIDIPANQTLIMELTARAQELGEEETEKTVSNRFEIEGENIEKISSDPIQHKVNKTVYKVDDDDKIVQTSSVSGLAWLDENANGTRDLNEKLLSGIPVILINESGKTIASNITGEKGEYIFNDIPVGTYIVVFLYDMANYDITAYGVGDSTKNCDVVMMNVNIEDISTPCGATNAINLTSNMYNIDLGLIVSPKFDLSLTKTISKITVQNAKGTTTNTYNNSKLEKVEIESKYLEGTTVAVEYVITVANVGAIPGYASRIVDYLSSTDLKFNSETNTDWYLGTDGNLYNSSLANKVLQPGESATLKLVLTKQVTEKNTGITNNTAEIYESYNDAGLEDYNSTPANKAQNENDLGQADIMIGPKTGVFLYIGFAIILMSIMTVAIYILNKKVIKRM